MRQRRACLRRALVLGCALGSVRSLRAPPRGAAVRLARAAASTIPRRVLASPDLDAGPDERNPRSGAYDFSMWSKAFESQREELDYFVREECIEGDLPRDLRGSFFRNMPALFERGDPPQRFGHYLDGDGKVARLTIADGRVHFANRFVRTREFAEEQERDEVLYRTTFRTQRPARRVGPLDVSNAFDLRLKNAANTHVIRFGGKLLALFEAGVPYELDPHTLETLGEFTLGGACRPGVAMALPVLGDLGGLLGRYATAHPKVDGATGALVTWCWSAEMGPVPSDMMRTVPKIRIHEFLPGGFRAAGEPVGHAFPGTSVVPHDFSITENFYVFVENKVGGDQLPYLLGTKNPAACVSVRAEERMRLHAVPRDGGEATVVPLAPGFTIHSPGAFEDEQGMLHLYTTAWRSENVTSGDAGRGGLLGAWEGVAPVFDEIPITLLYHTVVDAATGELVRHAPAEGLDGVNVEHPHINGRLEGRPFRYLWMSLGGQGSYASSPPLGVMRYDARTGERQEWYAPLHTYCEEVVVVPKDGAVDEDDVYVLSPAYDAAREQSLVMVFDGRHIDRGPVSTI